MRSPVSERHDLFPILTRRERSITVTTIPTNPARIGRVGADHVQVFIRPVLRGTELLAVVERLEQLFDAGYDTIDVVFE